MTQGKEKHSRLCFPFFQMFPKNQQKRNGGHDSADTVCKRLGIKGAFGSKEHGKYNGKKHVISLSPEGKYQGCFASSKSGKPIHKDVLEAEGDNHQGENTDSPSAKLQLQGIFGENPYKVFRHDSGKQEHQRGKAQAEN